jgi:single-stranded DNA-binding protein
LAKFAATLKAGTPVIVEGKIKPETYTADGVEHKTFSVKADYIRKIDYAAPSEASESKSAKNTAAETQPKPAKPTAVKKARAA